MIRKRRLLKARRHRHILRLRGVKVKEVGGREISGEESSL